MIHCIKKAYILYVCVFIHCRRRMRRSKQRFGYLFFFSSSCFPQSPNDGHLRTWHIRLYQSLRQQGPKPPSCHFPGVSSRLNQARGGRRFQVIFRVSKFHRATFRGILNFKKSYGFYDHTFETYPSSNLAPTPRSPKINYFRFRISHRPPIALNSSLFISLC